MTDGPAAADGATISNLNAEVEFDVRDDASDLISVMSQSGSASHLTEANSITVDAAGTGSVVNA